MLAHYVSLGESPMKIAAKYTGHPQRMSELIAANPQKPKVQTSQGVTFASLTHGERLNIPSHWPLPPQPPTCPAGCHADGAGNCVAANGGPCGAPPGPLDCPVGYHNDGTGNCVQDAAPPSPCPGGWIDQQGNCHQPTPPTPPPGDQTAWSLTYRSVPISVTVAPRAPVPAQAVVFFPGLQAIVFHGADAPTVINQAKARIDQLLAVRVARA